MREWKPGDVAVIGSQRWRRLGNRWVNDLGSQEGREPHGLRPLAVIDPESAEQVERLAALLRLNGGGARYAHMSAKGAREDFDALRAALRGLVAPPKPQVYSHIVVSRSDQKIKESLCGKVWRPEPDVEVVGQCPNCRDQAEVWIP